jgi:hypothetical protein
MFGFSLYAMASLKWANTSALVDACIMFSEAEVNYLATALGDIAKSAKLTHEALIRHFGPTPIQASIPFL